MLRSLIAAALVISLPTFADEASREATPPEATFAAEGTVIKVSARSSDDGVDWAEITFKVTRCIAGPCTTHQSLKVMVAFSQWRSKHGETLGLVRYDWRDSSGGPRTWSLAHRLDDVDQKERFDADCEKAVANVGAPSGDSAVATR